MQLQPSGTSQTTAPDGSTLTTLAYSVPNGNDVNVDSQDTFNALQNYLKTGNYVLQQPVITSNNNFTISYSQGTIPTASLQPNVVTGAISSVVDKVETGFENVVETLNGGTINSPAIGGGGFFSDLLTMGVLGLFILIVFFVILK